MLIFKDLHIILASKDKVIYHVQLSVLDRTLSVKG